MAPATSYHLGFTVPDLDAAAAQMRAATGVEWRPVHSGRLGEWEYRITFSVQGPPYLELVEGPAGSPWDSSAGPRLDHLGIRLELVDVAQQPAFVETWQAPGAALPVLPLRAADTEP